MNIFLKLLGYENCIKCSKTFIRVEQFLCLNSMAACAYDKVWLKLTSKNVFVVFFSFCFCLGMIVSLTFIYLNHFFECHSSSLSNFEVKEKVANKFF